MTRRCTLAALLLTALAWPAPSGANVFPFGPLTTDYIRLMAGIATDFEHGGMYAGEIGWLFRSSPDEKALSIGPVVGLAANGDTQRFSIGPHAEHGVRIGPEFVYRRDGGASHLGGALHLGLEIPMIIFAAGVGGRLGVTEGGFFGELGLTFVLRIPAGPRAAKQLARANRPQYPRCDDDADCAFRGEYCDQGRCEQCREDAHCVPRQWTCEDCPECLESGVCSGPRICSLGRCESIAPQ